MLHIITNLLCTIALLLAPQEPAVPPYLDPGDDGAFGLCSRGDWHPVPDHVCTTAPLECYVPCLAGAIEDYLAMRDSIDARYCNLGTFFANAYNTRRDQLLDLYDDRIITWRAYIAEVVALNAEVTEGVDQLRRDADAEHRTNAANFLRAAEHCCQDCTQGAPTR